VIPEGIVIPRKDILYANPFHLPDQWAFEEKQVLHEATETNPHLVAKKLKNQTLKQIMRNMHDPLYRCWNQYLKWFSVTVHIR